MTPAHIHRRMQAYYSWISSLSATPQGHEWCRMQDDGQRLPQVSHGSVCNFFSPRNFTLLWKEEECGFGNCLGSKKWWYRQFSSSLMAPDEFRNLGFPDEDRVEPVPNHAGGATSHKVRDDGKKITWDRFLRPSGQWISSACKGIGITARSNSTNSYFQVQVHYHYLTDILIKLLFRGAEYCLLCWSLNTVPVVKGQSSRPVFNLISFESLGLGERWIFSMTM